MSGKMNIILASHVSWLISRMLKSEDEPAAIDDSPLAVIGSIVPHLDNTDSPFGEHAWSGSGTPTLRFRSDTYDFLRFGEGPEELIRTLKNPRYRRSFRASVPRKNTKIRCKQRAQKLARKITRRHRK